MSSKKAMKQAQKMGFAKHRSNFNNSKNFIYKTDLNNKISKEKRPKKNKII